MNAGAGAAAVNPFMGTPPIGAADVKAAAGRIGQRIRPVTLVAADPGPFDRTSLYLACESTQVTGSCEARGAANLLLYHHEHGALPEAAAAGGAPCGRARAGRWSTPGSRSCRWGRSAAGR